MRKAARQAGRQGLDRRTGGIGNRAPFEQLATRHDAGPRTVRGDQYRPAAPAMRRYSRAHQAMKPRRSSRRGPLPTLSAVTATELASAISISWRRLAANAAVAHDDVGLEVQQQRQRVDVGAADGRPVVVDHRHLGVQERRRVLVDLHAVGEHLVAQRIARRVRPCGSPSAPAAAGARARRAARRRAARGGSRGRGRSRPTRCRCCCARAADRLDVAALDAAPLAQVVAHQEGGAHRPRLGLGARAAAGRCERRRPSNRLARASGCALPASATTSSRQAWPSAARIHIARAVRVHGRRKRAAHAHREVQPRQLAPAVVQVETVVDQVDAADERHLGVDDAQLVVQAAQLARLQPVPPAVQRPEQRHVHTGLRAAAPAAPASCRRRRSRRRRR